MANDYIASNKNVTPKKEKEGKSDNMDVDVIAWKGKRKGARKSKGRGKSCGNGKPKGPNTWLSDGKGKGGGKNTGYYTWAAQRRRPPAPQGGEKNGGAAGGKGEGKGKSYRQENAQQFQGYCSNSWCKEWGPKAKECGTKKADGVNALHGSADTPGEGSTGGG